jgi:hypothetical protein
MRLSVRLDSLGAGTKEGTIGLVVGSTRRC